MEIKIDETIVNDVINKTITNAVVDSFNSYSLKKLIEEKVCGSVINVAIEDVLKSSFELLDIKKLVGSLVKELEKAVVALATNSIKEAMCSVVLQIRVGNGYISDDERKKELIKIRHELEHYERGNSK